MKKILMLPAAAVLLTSCGLEPSRAGDIEPFSGFEITSESYTYSTDTKKIEFTIYDNYYLDFSYGEKWELDKKVDGEWKRIPYKEESWKAVAYGIRAHKEQSFTIDLSLFDYSFNAGEYRYYQEFDASRYGADNDKGSESTYAVFEFELE